MPYIFISIPFHQLVWKESDFYVSKQLQRGHNLLQCPTDIKLIRQWSPVILPVVITTQYLTGQQSQQSCGGVMRCGNLSGIVWFVLTEKRYAKYMFFFKVLIIICFHPVIICAYLTAVVAQAQRQRGTKCNQSTHGSTKCF